MPWRCNVMRIIGTCEVPELNEAPPEYHGVGGRVVSRTVLIDNFGEPHSFDSLLPGTVFEVPPDVDYREWPWRWSAPDMLSDYYCEHNSHRRPLLLVLPGRTLFAVDGKCWNDGGSYGGWRVSGDAVTLTIQPSVNIKGIYHGFVTQGVVSNDCEGRLFDAMGFPTVSPNDVLHKN